MTLLQLELEKPAKTRSKTEKPRRGEKDDKTQSERKNLCQHLNT